MGAHAGQHGVEQAGLGVDDARALPAGGGWHGDQVVGRALDADGVRPHGGRRPDLDEHAVLAAVGVIDDAVQARPRQGGHEIPAGWVARLEVGAGTAPCAVPGRALHGLPAQLEAVGLHAVPQRILEVDGRFPDVDDALVDASPDRHSDGVVLVVPQDGGIVETRKGVDHALARPYPAGCPVAGQDEGRHVGAGQHVVGGVDVADVDGHGIRASYGFVDEHIVAQVCLAGIEIAVAGIDDARAAPGAAEGLHRQVVGVFRGTEGIVGRHHQVGHVDVLAAAAAVGVGVGDGVGAGRDGRREGAVGGDEGTAPAAPCGCSAGYLEGWGSGTHPMLSALVEGDLVDDHRVGAAVGRHIDDGIDEGRTETPGVPSVLPAAVGIDAPAVPGAAGRRVGDPQGRVRLAEGRVGRKGRFHQGSDEDGAHGRGRSLSVGDGDAVGGGRRDAGRDHRQRGRRRVPLVRVGLGVAA